MFQTQSPTRTNIEEANKHLKMLYTRVDELENKVEFCATLNFNMGHKRLYCVVFVFRFN